MIMKPFDTIDEYIQRRIKGLEDRLKQPTPSACLHLNCPECNGTGIKKSGGYCVHMISCPCNKCKIT